MTIITTTPTNPAIEAPTGVAPVALDLYRDIHKGVRAELFAVVEATGKADPSDPMAWADVASHVSRTVAVLETHAEHEDVHVQPHVERELPALADQIATAHAAFDVRHGRLRSLADEVAGGGGRPALHELYLELAAFTGDYLLHQDVEERVLMPALEAAVGIDVTLGIHTAIVTSHSPDEMAEALSFMLPAMNLDDRAELLGGIREGAPPEVFTGICGLARSVLRPADSAALDARLGL